MTDQNTTTGSPSFDAASLEQSSAFVAAAGLILDEVTATHQQLWQVNIENGVGKLIAHGEVRLQNISPGRP